MNIPGRDRPAGLRVLAISLSLMAVFIAAAAVSADSYAPFCEAPIQQCASEDRGPHGSGDSIQLHPQSRCVELRRDVTAGLTSVVYGDTSDPHVVFRVAELMHNIAHFCPVP